MLLVSVEVKELTPEFYYLPILRLCQPITPWETQEGVPVGDVELPPWANSATRFVDIMRAALESEHSHSPFIDG